jgi:hypothetical protein
VPRQTPPAAARLVSDGPIRSLLLKFEREAEFVAMDGAGSPHANMIARWAHELRQALEQAAREDIVVPLAELTRMTGRSERTVRRWAEAGKLAGVSRRGGRWVVSTSAARGAA